MFDVHDSPLVLKKAFYFCRKQREDEDTSPANFFPLDRIVGENVKEMVERAGGNAG